MKMNKPIITSLACMALQFGVTAATINFDAIDASGGTVSGATVASYLAQYGVTISGVTPGSQVQVADDRNVYGGGILVSPSGHNTLSESQNGPIHFTLNFSVPQSSVSFTRAGLGATLSSFTAWSAHAFNASNIEVSTASEGTIIAANLPPRTFTLTGPGITSVRWDANNVSQGFSSIVMDDLVLPDTSAPDSGRIYVCNSADDTVSAISLNTLQVLTNIAVGDGPDFVIVTPDGSKAYVANRLTNTVSVIRTSTDSVIATILVEKEPTQIAVSRNGQRVYVANRGSNTISIIDTVSNTVITNVPTSRPSPITLAYHPVRDEVWVGYNSGQVGGGAIEARSASNLSLLASTASSFIYFASFDLAFLPDGSEVYGAEGCGFCGRYNRISGNHTNGNIPIIQGTFFENNQGAALAVAVNPISSRVYLAKLGQNGGPNLVREFDRNAIPQLGRTMTFSAAPIDLTVTPDGQRLFVVNPPEFGFNPMPGPGFVSVIDTATFTTLTTVTVGNSARGIAIKPNPPIIVTIAVADVQISWNSISNATYRVDYKSTLTTNSWTPLVSCVRATNSTTRVLDAVLPDSPQRFYRVVSTNCVPLP